TGPDVPQQDTVYVARAADGVDLYFVALQTRYRDDDGTGAQTRTTGYTWQGVTAQPASVTVTLPSVSAAQNGPGTAASTTAVYDAFGRATWSRDPDGFLTYTQYDPTTGAVVKHIADVDTTRTAD